MKLDHVGKSIQPMKTCSEHSHPYWELVYNEKGTGSIFIDGVSHPFDENSIMLYPPQTMHQKVAQTQFEDYYLHFSGCELPSAVYVFQDPGGVSVLPLLKVLYNCYHETRQLSVCASLLEAVMGLLAPEETDMDKNVRQLRHILVNRFADADFKVADAMAQVPLNEDYLRRCFKKELGMTPQEYLNHLRIENAKKLISQSGGAGIRIAEAAYLSGFYDPLYFSRLFRKATGLSPSRWQAEQERKALK